MLSGWRRPGALAVMLALVAVTGLSGCAGTRGREAEGGAKSAKNPQPAPVAQPAVTSPEPAPAANKEPEAVPVSSIHVPPAAADASPEPKKPEPKPEVREPALPGAVGVMVENSWGARPQVGLNKADLIFEMEAEYGITRFLALYHRQKADRIGPVRSARMHFYDIAKAYRIPYAHAGGSAEVLLELRDRNTHLLNLDEIYTCGGCFWRSRDRKPPHNLYTSTDLLVGHARAAGFRLHPLPALPVGEPPSAGKPVETIAFSWGPKSQEVEWHWNGERYQRTQSGVPHLLEENLQIETDNLILLFTRFRWNGQSNNGIGSYQVEIAGSGDGLLYRGGKRYPVRWEKPSREEHYRLTNPDGSPVPLAEGQTWITILKGKQDLKAGLSQ